MPSSSRVNDYRNRIYNVQRLKANGKSGSADMQAQRPNLFSGVDPLAGSPCLHKRTDHAAEIYYFICSRSRRYIASSDSNSSFETCQSGFSSVCELQCATSK